MMAEKKNEVRILTDKYGRQFVDNDARSPVSGYIGETRVGYMCATDFADELGQHACTRQGVPEGTKIYDSVEELKQVRECIAECGYVKVMLVTLEFGR